MTIHDLIEEAKARCPEFKRKITHRLEKRKKAPEFDWLFNEFKRILGDDFLKAAARQELARVRAGKDDTDSHELHVQAHIQAAKELGLYQDSDKGSIG